MLNKYYIRIQMFYNLYFHQLRPQFFNTSFEFRHLCIHVAAIQQLHVFANGLYCVVDISTP